MKFYFVFVIVMSIKFISDHLWFCALDKEVKELKKRIDNDEKQL